jgi:hypothetical protein
LEVAFIVADKLKLERAVRQNGAPLNSQAAQ